MYPLEMVTMILEMHLYEINALKVWCDLQWSTLRKDTALMTTPCDQETDYTNLRQDE